MKFIKLIFTRFFLILR